MAKDKIIRVRPRGEITLPAVFREVAGIEPGDYLRCEVMGDGAILLTKVFFAANSQEPPPESPSSDVPSVHALEVE